MPANVNRDTVSWQVLARPRDGLPKAVLRTESALETALPPFRYYHITQLLKAPCRTCWSSFLNVLASTSAGTAMDCQRLAQKRGSPRGLPPEYITHDLFA